MMIIIERFCERQEQPIVRPIKNASERSNKNKIDSTDTAYIIIKKSNDNSNHVYGDKINTDCAKGVNK